MGKKIIKQKKVKLTRRDGMKPGIDKKRYGDNYEKIFGKK